MMLSNSSVDYEVQCSVEPDQMATVKKYQMSLV